MKTRDLVAMGIPAGPGAEAAKQILQKARAGTKSVPGVMADLKRVAASPAAFVEDPEYKALAERLLEHEAAADTFKERETEAPYRIWGEGLEADAVRQLKNACRLPVAVSGALMPDAHVGYGLPIG